MAHFVATEAQLPVVGHGLGSGWAELLRDLNVRLFHLDPPARASCAPDGSGGGASVFVYDPRRRVQTRWLCEETERTMRRTCERCGAPGAVRIAAHAVQILCADCGAPSEGTSST